MRIAIIGRTEVLYNTVLSLHQSGHDIVCILTAREAPEYTRTAADFQKLAQTWQIPFAQGAKIIEHYDFLRVANADIAVSMNYTGVVPQSVIDLFPLGVLNAHGGDLPRYRGNACQAWAILNGEERIGLCIHKMIGDKIDSGDIIARDYLPIGINTTITEVWNWMHERTPQLFQKAVDLIAKNPEYVLESQSKDPKDALRCYPRQPEDGEIDFNMPSVEVLRLINASNKPYAGAYCFLNEQKIIIWEAELVDDDELFLATPGQVTCIFKDYIEVACRKGKIRIHSAEVNGKIARPTRWVKSIRERLT